MKFCDDCKHADWRLRVDGKLHPDGSGNCRYECKLPQLPASMWWLNRPIVCGGSIQRKKELMENCVYWARKDEQ